MVEGTVPRSFQFGSLRSIRGEYIRKRCSSFQEKGEIYILPSHIPRDSKRIK
jgi:hypothetical protein